MINIIQNRKIFFVFSGTLVIASIAIVLFMGIRTGIDFTGGSLIEVAYTRERPSADSINTVLSEQGIESVQLQAVDEDGYLIRLPDIEDTKRRDIITALRQQIGDSGEAGGSVVEPVISEDSLIKDVNLGFEGEDTSSSTNQLIEERFETIGPVIGQELKSKSIEALIVVLLAIMIYIAWAFRKVSWPVKSWKYGTVALITLFHDVLIVFGIYTLLSHVFGWELNTAFVAAILTILGYSVNDTIVVFDRIRENVPRLGGTFEEVVNISVNQTISRSLITSLTTFFVLVAILVIGGTTIQSFVSALALGVVVGTYSSIFIASPLLVTAQNITKKG